jgi:hypothetical protein
MKEKFIKLTEQNEHCILPLVGVSLEDGTGVTF